MAGQWVDSAGFSRNWCSGRPGHFAGLLIALLVLVAPPAALAADNEPAKRDERPERGIAIYSDYSGRGRPAWARASGWTSRWRTRASAMRTSR